MGCLKLTYENETPALFLGERPEKIESLNWHVWVNPDSDFLGVVDQQTQGEEGFWEGIWNSGFMRLIVPDVYTIDVNYAVALGLGASETYTLNLITRGKDAGWHRTNTQ